MATCRGPAKATALLAASKQREIIGMSSGGRRP